MNSGQLMWSHERDTYSLTKKEKGGSVWEYPEGVVGRMKRGVPPPSVQIAFVSLRAARRQLPSQVPTVSSVGWVP